MKDGVTAATAIPDPRRGTGGRGAAPASQVRKTGQGPPPAHVTIRAGSGRCAGIAHFGVKGKGINPCALQIQGECTNKHRFSGQDGAAGFNREVGRPITDGAQL